MLKVAIGRVRTDKVDVLRAWMDELSRRADEVLETLEAETTRREQVHLLHPEGSDPILVYVIDVEDPDRASQAFANSPFPLDARDKEVMGEVELALLQPNCCST